MKKHFKYAIPSGSVLLLLQFIITKIMEINMSFLTQVIIYTFILIAINISIFYLLRDKKEKSLPQKNRKYDTSADCVFDGTLGSPGWFINRKTDEKFCYDCRGEGGSKIHLIRKSLSEWFCPKCKRPYESKVERKNEGFIYEESPSFVVR